jgi:hypothetical protein
MSEELTDRQAKQVDAAIERESEEHDKPAEVDPHEDRTREMRTPGFSRMRTEWDGPDAHLIGVIRQLADDRVFADYVDAYEIINDIYEIVRQPVGDANGEPVLDSHGYPVWERTESGRFIEDYSRLGRKEREEFLFQIVTRLFDWEQRSADAWAEAMFAKAQWEERFAIAFADKALGGRQTDESMTQRGRLGSRQERYFAIFQSYYSRKCEALVKSLERLSQRLKDSLYS